jgi:uncharacterized protein YcsI (UPF0317 family)
MLNITDPAEARKIIRADKYDKQTAGIAGKYVQGNICILPSKYALDFAQENNLVFSKVCKQLCSKKNDLSKMIIIDKK